jgi:NADH dehydrogenase [ubiquinone] 1 alpha subcomplex assembly factor 7
MWVKSCGIYVIIADVYLAQPLGPITQRDFLLQMGLEPRVEMLTASAISEKRKGEIKSSAQRLVDPTGMGTQYKILGIIPNHEAQSDDAAVNSDVYPFNR